MKSSVITWGGLAIIILAGCQKERENKKEMIDPLIISARNYFSQNESSPDSDAKGSRFSIPRSIQWDKAKIIKLSSLKAVIAPVKYLQSIYMHSSLDTTRLYAGDQITWLCIYLDKKQQYHIEQVGFFPDINYKTNGVFTGLISVDDWHGDPITKYIIQQNQIILKWNASNKIEKQQSSTITNSADVNELAVVETCYEIEGYNYSVDNPEGGTSWVESEGCSYSVVGTSEDGIPGALGYTSIAAGGGSGSTISSTSTFTIPIGFNIIPNIIEYNKCFTNIAGNGNTFSVTICVEEPEPGTRNPWVVSASGVGGSAAGSNPISTGHAFLIFTQSTGSTIITRNIGFYPEGSVTPLTPSNQGELNDDEGHIYNISLTVTVNNSQFFNMLTFVSNGNNPGYLYNLNSNNCTTFVLNALKTGGIILPNTIGIWAGGSGNDPGDLGEDIRSLALTSNMTRSTMELSHPNSGTCN